MCGINGMVFLKGVERNNEMMAKIRYVFDELMVETQDRGEHATGLASFQRDGSYMFHKKDINADTMTTEDTDYRNIVSNFDGEKTSVVIAHTRYLTKGKADNMNNNHPFDIGNVIGLHNGSAKNDDHLFTKYKDEFDRIGEVDSEIVFQLINHYNKETITKEGLSKALEDTKLRGLFALAFVHKNNPNMLHLVKQDKPMYIAYWKEAGVIIFNSIDTYIEKAFRKLERVGHTLGLQNTAQTVDIVKPTADRYFTIDANSETLKGAISEEVRMYIETTAYTYTSSDYSSTKSTTGTTTSTGYKSQYKSVTAQDSKGITLQGEIDTVTGEVVIWSNNEISVLNDDDGSGLDDSIEETCFECQEWLLEEDVMASYNANNPLGERVCSECYREVMDFMMSDDLREENKVG